MHNNKPLSAVGAEQHQWSVPQCVMNCAFKIAWKKKKKSIFSERWINQYASKVVPRLKRRTGFSFINQQTASHQIWLAHRASVKSRLNAVGQSWHGAVLNLELGAHVSWRPQLFFYFSSMLINVPARSSGLTAGTAPCVTVSWQWWMAGRGRRMKLRIKAELWAK